MTSSYGIGGTGTGLFALNVIALVFTWTAVGLRIWTRTRIVKVFGTDDWLMIAAMGTFTWMNISIMLTVWYGFGRHEDTLPTNQVVTGFMLAFFVELAYILTIMFLRLSVCFLYLRLTPLRWQKITLYVLAIVNTLYGIFYFFLILFQCKPVSYSWEEYGGAEGSCMGGDIAIYASIVHNALSVISDLTLALLPVFLLKKSKLNFRTKVIVCFLLSIGGIASIASIVRFSVLDKLEQTDDYTYTVIPVILWSDIEPFLGIFASNIATFRPLFRRMIDDTTYAGGYPGAYGAYGGSHHNGSNWSKSRRSRRDTLNGYILNGDGRDELSFSSDPNDVAHGRNQTRCEAGEAIEMNGPYRMDSKSDVNLVIQQRNSIEVTIEKV